METDLLDLSLTSVRILYIIGSQTNSSHTNNYNCGKEEIMEKELKNKERHIGYEVRTLDNMIGRRVNCWHSKMDEEVGITRMQAWIIGYVYELSLIHISSPRD